MLLARRITRRVVGLVRVARRTLVMVAVLLTGCQSQVVPAATPTSDTTVLRVYATRHLLPLLEDLASAYSAATPGVLVEVAVAHPGALMAQVQQGQLPYFLTTSVPTDSPLWAAPVGQDALVIVVNAHNPVASLSLEQVRQVFQGRISRWQTLGGAPLPISVVSQPPTSDVWFAFDRLVLGGRRMVSTAQVATSSHAVRRAVAASQSALGVMTLADVDGSVRPLSLEGVLPTQETVLGHTYPLRLTVYITGQAEPSGPYRDFVGWVQSDEGQRVVARRYTPLFSVANPTTS